MTKSLQTDVVLRQRALTANATDRTPPVATIDAEGTATSEITFGNGARHVISLEVRAHLEVELEAFALEGQQIVATHGTVRGRLEVWGVAEEVSNDGLARVRHQFSPAVFNYTLGPRWPLNAVLAAEDGRVLAMDSMLRMADTGVVPVDPDQITPYAFALAGTDDALLLRLWISLPRPFYYEEEELDIYDYPGKAQVVETSGSFLARVIGCSGNPVSGATIHVGSHAGITDSNGEFFAGPVAPGPVTVRIIKDGYLSVTQTRRMPALLDVSPSFTLSEGARVSGTVFAGFTVEPVDGATVSIPALGRSVTTDARGLFEISAIPEGRWGVIVSKDGFVESEDVFELASSCDRISQALRLTRESPITITEVTTRFGDSISLLHDVEFEVDLQIGIDWGSHSRSGTLFLVEITGGSERLILESEIEDETTFSKTVEVASDFTGASHSQLLVRVVHDDRDLPPAERLAKLLVVPSSVPPDVWKATTLGTDDFGYSTSRSLDLEALQAWIPADAFPEDLPIIHGEEPFLQWVPSVGATVSSSGRFALSLEFGSPDATEVLKREWGRTRNTEKMLTLLDQFIEEGKVDRRRMPRAGMGSLEFKLFPVLEYQADYSRSRSQWVPVQGSILLGGSAEWKRAWQQVLLAPLGSFVIPVPWYGQLAIGANGVAGVDLAFADLTSIWNEVPALLPFQQIEGRLGIDFYIAGALGAGVYQFLAGEVWAQGGAHLGAVFPRPWDELWELYGFLRMGYGFYVLGYVQREELFRWEWPTGEPKLLELGTLRPPSVSPQPIGREYTSSPGFNRFVGAATEGRVRPGLEREEAGAPAIQTEVYPYSEPATASHGERAHAAWISDNPRRSDPDRTMLVHAVYDGRNWTEPAAVGDDGTADYSPDILCLSDGTPVAAWLNIARRLESSATLAEVSSLVEVAVAFGSSGSTNWKGQVLLTNDDRWDRTPILAGADGDDLRVFWLSCDPNYPLGGSEHPAFLMSSRWNGLRWGEPERILTAPWPILGYDAVSHRSRADVVLAADLDGDSSTSADQELMYLAYRDGSWHPLQRLSQNDVPDTSPRLMSTADRQVMLVWIRGDRIESCVDFELNQSVALSQSGFPVNMASFSPVHSVAGLSAVVWSQPSPAGPDLWLAMWDRARRSWGFPQPLTQNAEFEKWASATALGEDGLVVVFDRETARPPASTAKLAARSNEPKNGTDLCFLHHQFVTDLALDADSFRRLPPFPQPDDGVQLEISAYNGGNVTIEDAPLALYSDELVGGVRLATAVLEGSLLPGETRQLVIPWPHSDASTGNQIVAIADPDLRLPDTNRANNHAVLILAGPDLMVAEEGWRWVDQGRMALSFRVTNGGQLESKPAAARLEWPGANGISEQAVPSLAVSASWEGEFEVDLSTAAPADTYTFAINAPGAFDLNPTDNQREFVVGQILDDLAPTLWIPDPTESGTVELRVHGVPGITVQLERSSDLREWVAFAEVALTQAIHGFTDEPENSSEHWFYRAQVLLR